MITYTSIATIKENGKYNLSVVVNSADPLPVEVLLFRKDGIDIYVHVCNIAELQQYGTSYGDGIPFVRLNTLSKDFDTVTDMQAFKVGFKSDMEMLNNDYELYVTDNNFNEPEVTEI